MSVHHHGVRTPLQGEHTPLQGERTPLQGERAPLQGERTACSIIRGHWVILFTNHLLASITIISNTQTEYYQQRGMANRKQDNR